MKKILAILMAIAMVFSFAACGTKKDNGDTEKKLKVGFIFLHDENSTYDNNFMTGAEEACKKMGVEILKKTNIPEQNACYDAAADLVDKGCTVVFADSFGHEDFMIKAAKEFPNQNK